MAPTALRAVPLGESGIELNPYAAEAASLVDRAYSRWAFANARMGPLCLDPIGPWAVHGESWNGVELLVARRPLKDTDGGRLEVGCGSRSLVALVLPGTNAARDWIDGNLNPWPVEIGGLPGRYRRGFVRAGEWAWSRLRAALCPGDRYLITGHSYGAAAATIAAAYAMRDGYAGEALGVLAFASPRATTARAAAELNRVYSDRIGQRFALGFDVVPHAVPGLVWRHAFDPVFVGSDGTPRNRFGFFRELGAAFRAPGLQVLDDHAMRRYLVWTLGVLPPPWSTRPADVDPPKI